MCKPHSQPWVYVCVLLTGVLAQELRSGLGPDSTLVTVAQQARPTGAIRVLVTTGPRNDAVSKPDEEFSGRKDSAKDLTDRLRQRLDKNIAAVISDASQADVTISITAREEIRDWRIVYASMSFGDFWLEFTDRDEGWGAAASNCAKVMSDWVSRNATMIRDCVANPGKDGCSTKVVTTDAQLVALVDNRKGIFIENAGAVLPLESTSVSTDQGMLSSKAVVRPERALTRGKVGRQVFVLSAESESAFSGSSNPSNFVLVRMRVDEGARTINLGSGVLMGRASVGVRPEDALQTETTRLKDNLYKVVPKHGLPPGEYCFVNLLLGGRVFDFGVD